MNKSSRGAVVFKRGANKRRDEALDVKGSARGLSRILKREAAARSAATNEERALKYYNSSKINNRRR